MHPRFSTWNKQLAAGICVLLVATACFASSSIVRGNVSVFLNGVDSGGSPYPPNGTTVTGKAYKDTTTGVIVQLAHGTVINDYGTIVIFSNQGVTITDPQTLNTLTATSDVEVVTGRGCAIELAIYDPAVVIP
jgi:hypothetical protein